MMLFINLYRQKFNNNYSFIMESQDNLLENWEAITAFMPYLSITDMLKSSTLSKTWHYNLGQYIQKVLLSSDSLNANIDPFKALKNYYNRDLIILDNNTSKVSRFPFLVEEISVGNIVTAIKTIQGEHYLVSNSALQNFDKHQLLDNKYCVKMPKNINKVQCIGDYIYCLKNYEIIQYKSLQGNMLAAERLIDIGGAIQYFITSPAYCLIGSLDYNNQSINYIFPHNQPKISELKFTIPINSVPKDVFLTYGSHAYVASEQNIYQADLACKPINFSPSKMLKGKKISKIIVGKGHSFAFQIKKKPIRQWEISDVINWANTNGFQDYVKIFKAQSITGKKLVQMSKTYMQDSLGITGSKTQQKMKLLIEEAENIQSDPQNYQVWGWGRNDKGQLGTNPSKNMSNIVKPKIPEGYAIWKCIGNNTIIKKINSQVYMINNVQDNKQIWNILHSEKIWSIGSTKNNCIIYLASTSKAKVPQRMSQQPIDTEKKKMKTAKNVLDKIQWDQKYQKEDFQVGYMDRYEGMLEMGLIDFLKGDEKQHKIYYFKHKGKIVWDRNKRIDLL